MQLLDYDDIELLLGNENFNVSTPQRRRHSHIKQRLFQIAATDRKPFYSILTSAVTVLHTSGHAHFEIGPDNRTKNQALPGSLLETGFSLKYLLISFERRAKDLLQSDRACRVCK